MRTSLLVLSVWAFPAFAQAATVARTNSNTDTSTLFWAKEITGSPSVSKQHVLNNLSRIDSVRVFIKTKEPEYVTVKLAHGSGGGVGWHYWGGKTVGGLATAQGAWVTIPLTPAMNVTYGQYIIMEVTTQNAWLGFNRDRYNGGRRFRADDITANENWSTGDLVSYDESGTNPVSKKDDLLFELVGVADSATNATPLAATNVVSPGGCVPIYAKEFAPNGSTDSAINILFREIKRVRKDNAYVFLPGSFYSDDITALKNSIKANLVIAPTPDYDSINNTEPFKTWFAQGKINLYIARESPNNDPEYLRGFGRCANVDFVVDLITGTPTVNASEVGSFQVRISDPRTGGPQGTTLMHELAHAMGMFDEYVCDGTIGPCNLADNAQFSLNTAPIGCTDPTSANWCTGSLTAAQLRAQMFAVNDPAKACWDATTPQQCAAGNCHDISALNIPYFNGYSCVPKTIVKYDIGTGCIPNSGCYIGSASPGWVSLNGAQPAVPVLQTGHALTFYKGFGGAMEVELDAMFGCIFSTSCGGYPATSCATLEDRWDGGASPNPNNIAFLKRARSCDNGVNRRR